MEFNYKCLNRWIYFMNKHATDQMFELNFL